MEEDHPLYLVDGSGYIFRAFYAIHPLSTSKGLPTNALLGFSRMLAKLIRDVEAKYIAVAFDAGAKTFRHEMYDQYKANRDACPEDLLPQMPYFRKIVDAVGIQGLEKPGWEADDIIATLAIRAHEQGKKVVIVSGDKDLTQLVRDRIEMWDAMRDIVFTPEKVREKFGVSPEQMNDYLALIGDASDNVPGVKGVGPKSAQRLIEHFGSVDQMLEKVEEIGAIKGLRGARSLQEKIESGAGQLRLSRELIKLDINVEPYVSSVDVEDFAWEHAQAEVLLPLFEELELGSLSDSFALAPGSQEAATQNDPYEDKRYEIVRADSLALFADKLASRESFAFDTETSSLDVLDCDLVGISISWEQGAAYYLPLDGEVDKELHLDRALVAELLGPIFSDASIKKFGVNLKFDIEVLQSHGYSVAGADFDAMLCAYVLDPDKRDFGLKSLAKKHLGEQMIEFKEIVGDLESIAQVPVETVAKYACHDADASWALRDVLFPMLGDRDAEDSATPRAAFEDIEMPLVPVLADMERAGIKLDAAVLEKLGAEFSADSERLNGEIQTLAGEEFNLNSPKQLGVVLFENLGISTKGVKKTKTGFSTNASVLDRLSGEHEIIEKILEYREVHKLNSTYIDALQRLMHPKTGRVHASFNQAIAATGRLSSSDPNLQNIPIRTKRGRRIRDAFVAEPGSVLISADYSQVELRVLAHMSGDKGLCEAFNSGEDIHERTAREIFGAFGVSVSEMKELRRAAKTINFGLVYGMGAFRLAGDLGVSRKQAQEYIDSYFARYPGVLEYFDGVKRESEELGYVSTIFGHRRYTETLEASGRDAGYLQRSMMNAPIQGTAAEIIKLAMVRLHSRLADLGGSARMVLQVHDELVVEAEEDSAEAVSNLIVTEMEQAVELAVPLKVDVRVGPSWGEGWQ